MNYILGLVGGVPMKILVVIGIAAGIFFGCKWTVDEMEALQEKATRAVDSAKTIQQSFTDFRTATENRFTVLELGVNATRDVLNQSLQSTSDLAGDIAHLRKVNTNAAPSAACVLPPVLGSVFEQLQQRQRPVANNGRGAK